MLIAVKRHDVASVSVGGGSGLRLNRKNERMRKAFVGWRERNRSIRMLLWGSADEAVEPWRELLAELNYDAGPEWVFTLLQERAGLATLKQFLAQCEHRCRVQIQEKVRRSILASIDFFSRGAAGTPAEARANFVSKCPDLEALNALVEGEDLTSRLQFALDKFDLQVVARRASLEARLKWKPKDPQTRVCTGIDEDSYKPGSPHWWTGKLNDAPEMLGNKLAPEDAEKVALSLERSLLLYLGRSDVPRPLRPQVHTGNTYFSQGREPRVQFGELKDAPGVEGYLKKAPKGGPRVLEFPLEDGSFAYLMFDGHHRAAAQMIQGREYFADVTVMRLGDVELLFDLSEHDIVEAIRDLHTHLYMTDAPVPSASSRFNFRVE